MRRSQEGSLYTAILLFAPVTTVCLRWSCWACCVNRIRKNTALDAACLNQPLKEDAEADDVETDEDEEEEEEDDEDDEEAANDPKVQLLNSVVLRFSAEFGREPTMDEIKVG